MKSIIISLMAAVLLAAQTPAPPAAPKATNPVPPPKSQPITQEEKDHFRNLRIELLDLQAQYANQMLSLKQQIEDLQKKSNEDLTKKNQEAEQLYRALQARCAAPEALDLKSVECIIPAKK